MLFFLLYPKCDIRDIEKVKYMYESGLNYPSYPKKWTTAALLCVHLNLTQITKKQIETKKIILYKIPDSSMVS